MHSSSGLPPMEIGVSATEPSAEGRRRRPIEPVSISTLGIVAQFCVPCWQTVTVVKISLTNPPASPVGPKLAVTATELLTAGVAVVAVLELLFPQLDNTRTHITANTKGA